MQNAIAFCDNDVVVVAWSYGAKLAGCMGFAVYRIDTAGVETALPSMAVFPGFVAKPGQTTATFPVQKFYWKDLYACLVADRTGSRTFRSKIVPLAGAPGKLKPMTVDVVSNEIVISPVVAPGVAAVFNRGLISTQRVSNALGGKPSKSALLAAIAKPQGALRTSHAGDLIPALVAFVARAKSGGTLYAALYALGDDELIGALESAGKRLHVILLNPSAANQQSASAITDGNAASRQRLAKTAGQLIDRMLPNGQIGHNRYVVYVGSRRTRRSRDRQPQPRPPRVVQQRRDPRHGPRPARARGRVRDARARHLRPLLLALDAAAARQRPRRARGDALARFGDGYQSRYFDNQGNIKVAQLRFWPSALPAP